MSVPVHQDDATGLPVGVQVVAAPWRDDLLLRVVRGLELAHPWAARRPAVSRPRRSAECCPTAGAFRRALERVMHAAETDMAGMWEAGMTEIALPNPTESLRACTRRSPQLRHELETAPRRFRVLTGDRTTGALHVGHYFGSLKSRVTLQDWGVEIFLILADYQAITDRTSTDAIKASVREIILDYLATGIDPKKSTIFCHSMVPSLNQLLLPFLSVVSMSELQRNPTVKEEIGPTHTAGSPTIR